MSTNPRKTLKTREGASEKTPLTKTGTTVVVGCKMANGLNAHLHGNDRPPTTFHGSNHRNAVLGVGLTHGVDKDLWEAWLKTHEFLPAVKNGLLFAYGSADHVKQDAKDRKDLKHGFEAVDPRKPGKGVKPTDEQVKELDKLDGDDGDDGDED